MHYNRNRVASKQNVKNCGSSSLMSISIISSLIYFQTAIDCVVLVVYPTSIEDLKMNIFDKYPMS